MNDGAKDYDVDLGFLFKCVCYTIEVASFDLRQFFLVHFRWLFGIPIVEMTECDNNPVEGTAETNLDDSDIADPRKVSDFLRVVRTRFEEDLRRITGKEKEKHYTTLTADFNNMQRVADLLLLEVQRLKGIQEGMAISKASFAEVVREGVVVSSPGNESRVASSASHGESIPERNSPFIAQLYPKSEGIDVGCLVRQNIDPATLQLRISSFRRMRNQQGCLVVFEDRESQQKFNQEVHRTLSEAVVLKTPKLFRPQLRLSGIDGTVSTDAASFREQIRQQNSDVVFEDADLTVRSTFKNTRFGTSTVILDVTPHLQRKLVLRQKLTLGWTRVPVEEYVYVRRCRRCCSYGHLQSFCPMRTTGERICGQCAGIHGIQASCTGRETCCYACKQHNEQFGAHFNPQHEFFDRQCPVFLQQRELQQGRTEI